jgi:hypothetical protein
MRSHFGMIITSVAAAFAIAFVTTTSAGDVEGDRLTALTEQQMSTRATSCVGYWAAYYINRDGGWSVACDALWPHQPVRDRETSALGRTLSPSSSPAIAKGQLELGAHEAAWQ